MNILESSLGSILGRKGQVLATLQKVTSQKGMKKSVPLGFGKKEGHRGQDRLHGVLEERGKGQDQKESDGNMCFSLVFVCLSQHKLSFARSHPLLDLDEEENGGGRSPKRGRVGRKDQHYERATDPFGVHGEMEMNKDKEAVLYCTRVDCLCSH